MIVEALDWVNQTPAQRTLYVRKVGDLQPNSYDSSDLGMSDIVYVFRSQASNSAHVNNTHYSQGFPCQTYNPFSTTGFQITRQPDGVTTSEGQEVITPTNNWGILITYHFYKE